MAEFTKIAKTGDIPVGSMVGFTVSGKQILIANVAGKFYAMDAVCSHSFGKITHGRKRRTRFNKL